jgi:hypothetical protein
MRIITHGPFDKCDPTTPLAEFIDQEHLMHIVACSTIWCGDQHTFKSGHGRPIPEAIETGAVELGPTIAVIAIDMLVGDVPIGVRRHIVAEATQLMLNRLLLLLTRRRDTGVQSDFHGIPPDDAMAQGSCLRSVP